MGKVVGARINDLLYNKMIEDKKSNTEIIREALKQYYSTNKKNDNVNKSYLAVNTKKNKNRYQTISTVVYPEWEVSVDNLGNLVMLWRQEGSP